MDRHAVGNPEREPIGEPASSMTVQESPWRKFRQIGTGKRPRVYECYWAHFAAAIHLSE